MSEQTNRYYDFGSFSVDLGRRVLLTGGEPVPLTPKVLQTLLAMIENRGRVLTKDELLNLVWGDTIVEEGGLTRNISVLRKALGERPDDHQYIVTVPGRGYQFVAEVHERRDTGNELRGDEPASPADDFQPKRTLSARHWQVLGGLVTVALGIGLFVLFQTRRADVNRPEIKSLAVLPLQNLSGDPMQEYFADGMTEALIAGLAKVRVLRVTPRTWVSQYKETRKALPDIARELNVNAVVEGSVQRFGRQVKITTRLIRMPSNRQLWTETYQRDLGDVLALQNEIVQAVLHEVEIKLTPLEQGRLAKAHPVKPQAYDDYLRGRFYANRQNKADNETAIVMLERSVAADPSFASAHAELAQVYVWRFFLFTPGEKHWEERAFVAVEKALSLDPDLAEAYLARGRLLWTPANHFPHEKAIQEYHRALTLNPNLDEAQNQLALVYNHIGAFDQALQELQKAVAINPSNALAQFRIGQTFLFQGKYEQALTALRQMGRAVHPALVGHHTAMALLRLGKRDEAVALVVELLRGYPKDEGGVFSSVQALLSASAGEKIKAELEIRKSIEKGRGFGHFHHTGYNIACAYALMKEVEPAIQWLRTTADGGFPCYPLFQKDPYLDHVRQDPRFMALMATLKEQWEHYRTIL
jgi:TolB-like protein/DNA-binding winged helix-turn-helix (wHTH) protein/Tfp pilus assembly protein PilF